MRQSANFMRYPIERGAAKWRRYFGSFANSRNKKAKETSFVFPWLLRPARIRKRRLSDCPEVIHNPLGDFLREGLIKALLNHTAHVVGSGHIAALDENCGTFRDAGDVHGGDIMGAAILPE